MPNTPQLAQLVHDAVASRVWQRDTTLFADGAATEATHRAVSNRLGWLDAPGGMRLHVQQVEAFRDELLRDGLTDIYLLGMGGSSLCAEVLRDTLGSPASGFSLTVLDTTDELVIQRVTKALRAEHACFLVASKSGSTLEVTSLERHFWSTMQAAGLNEPGRHFAAITDPDTSLVSHAAASGYRRTFINPADIGGRYSALSLFGLIPAALCGVPLLQLLQSADGMADRCRQDEPGNPGLALGEFMGSYAMSGRDKLTTLIAPAAAALGAWIEQLVAESTGKQGRGVLPVVNEPIGDTADYGKDRAFVAVLTPDATVERQAAADLAKAGHPVFVIETTIDALGGEFFRWEFATAVAGVVLGVNPFDEPDVRGAKARTQAQLDARAVTGEFRIEPPFLRPDGILRRETGSPDVRPSEPQHYIAILDYLPADTRRAATVARVRDELRRRTGRPCTHGVGPRYLHSTGQYHKGGPNSGLFVLLTGADTGATDVPGSGYSFSTLKQAQAFGDFDALADARRIVWHFHVDDPAADFSDALERIAREVQ